MVGRTMILPCPHCRRRLRVPTDRGELVLTCPICRTRWDYEPPRPDDMRFLDEEVVLIGEGVAPGTPGPAPGPQSTGSVERENTPTSNGYDVIADLWDDYLDGRRPRERPGTVILPCPNCRQLLRVPANRGDLILTCPRCRTRWGWSPPAGSAPKSGGIGTGGFASYSSEDELLT